MTCAGTKTLEELRDIHNTTKKMISSIKKDIKASFKNDAKKTEADVEDLLQAILIEYGVDSSLEDELPSQTVYRINKNGSESSVNVHQIEKFKGGYKILYTTEIRGDAKVVRVASNGATLGAKYDVENLSGTYDKLQKRKAKDIPIQKTFEFNAEDGTKFDYTKENAEVINAELINDSSKSEEVFNKLLLVDGISITQEHIDMLRATLLDTTNMIKKVIPDMVQIIRKDADKNYGKVVLEGKNKGLYVGASGGAQIAGNQMSAAEMYVHELKHASLEYAIEGKRDVIANTLNDIHDVYKVFLENVTEEDFMPEISKSINRTEERKIAKARIAYLRNKDIGLNEFIVMSETNLVVQKVLSNIVVNGRTHKGNTFFEKLIAMIRTVYDNIYVMVRGSSKNLSGASAMSKYIKEISSVNNVATEELIKQNVAMKAVSDFMNFMNTKGNTHIKKILKKIRGRQGKAGDEFNKELADFMKNQHKYGKIKKGKFFMRMLGKWLTDGKVENVGAFETWLELMGAKPEGTFQQLIRVLRDSDAQETLVERLGLLANKVEFKVETSLTQQSEIINNLFDGELSTEDGVALTKGILDIELNSLVNPFLNGSEAEQMAEVIKVLSSQTGLDEEIKNTKDFIRKTFKSKEEANFVINQASGLGKYMITGRAGSGQLNNSFMINGMSNLKMSKNNIIKRNEGKDGLFKVALIDRLATLEGINNTDSVVKQRTLDMTKKNPAAVLSIMKYDEMTRSYFSKSDDVDYSFEMNRVKGHHEKINANWINQKVDLKTNADKNKKDNYRMIEGMTFNNDYALFVNSDHTAQGWVSEGMRMTNDGQKINSYINILKQESLPDDANIFDTSNVEKVKNLVKNELITVSKEVTTELEAMQDENYVENTSGMRPVFATNAKGEMFVTDMDLSVDKQQVENIGRTRNGVDTVLAKTYSRGVDLFHSKKVNKEILSSIYKDMYENYDDDKDYFEGGNKNLMSYVKIGPNEDNDINKEIWNVLPRYMKTEIIRGHYVNVRKQVSDIAKKIGVDNEEDIWSERAISLRNALKKVSVNDPKQVSKLFKINKDLTEELTRRLHDYLKKNENNELKMKEVKDIRKELNTITNKSPYIAVRRNLVYHYFGNREAALLSYGDRKSVNMVIRFMKQLDALWRHLVKIVKSNIVLRDLPVLAGNILSNVLLAVLQGRNPWTEVKQQISGMINLHRYREDYKMITKLNTKKAAGLFTKADENKLNLHLSNINKNPVKPLVDAGLYTSAVEDLSKEDLHRETYLDSVSNKYKKKLPQGMQNTIDALYLTKNTSTFTTLLLAMQYSDFAARYSTYYRLVDGGMTKDNAIKKVLDNQINYGFSHGKILQWLNARGFLMFTKFFEGIQRVIKNTTLDKPFNVLVAAIAGGMIYEDSPLGDSLISRNYGAMMHSPMDIIETLTERPAMIQIFTDKYN